MRASFGTHTEFNMLKKSLTVLALAAALATVAQAQPVKYRERR